jgi:hypothetical protein
MWTCWRKVWPSPTLKMKAVLSSETCVNLNRLPGVITQKIVMFTNKAVTISQIWKLSAVSNEELQYIKHSTIWLYVPFANKHDFCKAGYNFMVPQWWLWMYSGTWHCVLLCTCGSLFLLNIGPVYEITLHLIPQDTNLVMWASEIVIIFLIRKEMENRASNVSAGPCTSTSPALHTFVSFNVLRRGVVCLERCGSEWGSSADGDSCWLEDGDFGFHLCGIFVIMVAQWCIFFLPPCLLILSIWMLEWTDSAVFQQFAGIEKYVIRT